MPTASVTEEGATSDNEAPFGMSQKVVIFDPNNNSEDTSPTHQMVSNVVTNTVTTKNIYSQLIASFKELTNVY